VRKRDVDHRLEVELKKLAAAQDRTGQRQVVLGPMFNQRISQINNVTGTHLHL